MDCRQNLRLLVEEFAVIWDSSDGGYEDTVVSGVFTMGLADAYQLSQGSMVWGLNHLLHYEAEGDAFL